MNGNILLDDVLTASAPFMAHALNSLPENARARVVEAHEAGGWCELRIGTLNEAATVRVMLCNVDGAAVELIKIDHAPN